MQRYNSSVMNFLKNMNINQNVSIRVIDQSTGDVVQEHIGHNSATNSMLFGIAHHLAGDFLPNQAFGLNPAYPLLANYVPRYISLGTMGLINQDQDANGLPAGIGDVIPDSSDPEFKRLQKAVNDAKAAIESAEAALEDDCPYWPAKAVCETCTECSERIGNKKANLEAAKLAYAEAVEAFTTYNEEARFVEYMKRRPGYGADGYDQSENNSRDYFGLGYAYSSYNVSETYVKNDIVTYKGILYKCTVNATSGPFNPDNWSQLPDVDQPSLGTTVQLELVSPSFPRQSISYRDIVPESQSELPKTIDVVYSAMISTGALKQFRPEGQDYIFITEAGLWSKRDWEDSGENGLLAGYRIIPPNESNWDMTVAENRELLKRQILKVSKNQVVQVIWKIQIGTVEKFESDASQNYTALLFYLYGADNRQMLPGSMLKITADAEGEIVVNDAKTGHQLLWTTTYSPKSCNLYDNTYYLHQIDNVEGYKMSDPVNFKLAEGQASNLGNVGEVHDTTVIMLNELAYIPVYFRLLAEDTEQVLVGITLKITADSAGHNVVDDARTGQPLEWITGSTSYTGYLSDGTYYLHQEDAAQGYDISEPVVFEIVNNVLSKVSDIGRIDGSLITMVDPVESIVSDFVFLTSNGIQQLDAFNQQFSPGYSSTYYNILRYQIHEDPNEAGSYMYSLYEYPQGPSTYRLHDIDPYDDPGSVIRDNFTVSCETAQLVNGQEVVTPDHPLLINPEDGFYYCNTQIGFKDAQNMVDVLDATVGQQYSESHRPNTQDDVDVTSFKDWDASNIYTLPKFSEHICTHQYTPILDIRDLTLTNLTSLSDTFSYLEGQIIIGIDTIDTSKVTSMKNLFYNSTMGYFSEYDDKQLLRSWDVSNVTDVSHAFDNTSIGSNPCTLDETFGFGYWNLEAVQDMSCMFYNSTEFYIESPLFNYDTSHVTSMSGMFGYATIYSSDDFAPLSSWDLSNVTDYSHMFDTSGIGYKILGIESWDEQMYATGHIDEFNFYHMFHNVDSGYYPDWRGTFDSEGTFHPQSVDYLYNWDFTNSLNDTVNNVPATFYSDPTDKTSGSNTPSSNAYISGTGVRLNVNQSPLGIPVDLLSKTTEYTVEIDFTTFEFGQSKAGFLQSIGNFEIEPRLLSGTNYNLNITVGSCTNNSTFEWYTTTIRNLGYFENSTMKIVNRLTANNNIVLDIYKNNDLAFTTPEYCQDNVTPFLWDNSSLQIPFAIGGYNMDANATVTGMRIYENT